MVSPEFQSIPTSRVDEPREPSRVMMDPARVAALADDIATNGLLQPIGVAGPDASGRYALGFGHRRLLAHRLLERPTITALVWPLDTPLLQIRASENHQREQLTPIEEALEIERFRAAGESQASIARRYRRGVEWISSRLDLLTLPDELQEAVHTGALAVSVVNLLRQVDHTEYRRSLIREAIERGASAATVRVWVAHYEADRARIVTNHETIEQIAASRSAYVVHYRCEACDGEVPMQETSAFRFCTPCGHAIITALRDKPAPADARRI